MPTPRNAGPVPRMKVPRTPVRVASSAECQSPPATRSRAPMTTPATNAAESSETVSATTANGTRVATLIWVLTPELGLPRSGIPLSELSGVSPAYRRHYATADDRQDQHPSDTDAEY